MEYQIKQLNENVKPLSFRQAEKFRMNIRSEREFLIGLESDSFHSFFRVVVKASAIRKKVSRRQGKINANYHRDDPAIVGELRLVKPWTVES